MRESGLRDYQLYFGAKILFTRQYNRDVTVSCDNQVAFPSFIASIVVAVVAMYGVRWLAWLPKVCNYQLPV